MSSNIQKSTTNIIYIKKQAESRNVNCLNGKFNSVNKIKEFERNPENLSPITLSLNNNTVNNNKRSNKSLERIIRDNSIKDNLIELIPKDNTNTSIKNNQNEISNIKKMPSVKVSRFIPKFNKK